MNRFDALKRWTWSVFIVFTLAFAFAGCEGDDGAQGPQGPQGDQGPPGADGTDATADPLAAAKVESCGTCHGGVGEGHQAVYDEAYNDASRIALTITGVSSVDNGDGTFTVTTSFSVTFDGLAYVDTVNLAGLDQKRFYAVQHFAGTQEYLNSCSMGDYVLNDPANGLYSVQDVDCGYAPELSNAQVYGYVADGALFEHAGGSGAEIDPNSHVHLYADVSNAAVAFGTAAAGDASAYVSAANESGCQKCHGTPYLKHGYRAAKVDGIPDFAACKSCHFDNRGGGHEDWQYMVDEPLSWATDELDAATVEARYAYTANVMNDTHMSHAMEFPYPQSMQNCATCHEGKLDVVLDDAQFTAETCVSCHPVEGEGAWPKTVDANGDEVLDEDGDSIVEPYYQGNRAPALAYLWWEAGVDGFHNTSLICSDCHNSGPNASQFVEYHTGYDVNITDPTGVRYTDAYTVSIDAASYDADTGLITVDFSASDPAVVPELYVSFYGWDSKHFIAAGHERDANEACQGRRPGCQMEYTPESSGGGANPIFTENEGSVPGAWSVTVDPSLWQLTKTDDIPTMIADGIIRRVELMLAPELNLADLATPGPDLDVVLEGVSKTLNLGSGSTEDNYFKAENAVVSTEKCNVCHDVLASSFHSESGRGGDGIIICKNCHNPTYAGSHLELASRSIDSYVHAIHSFQDFDVGDTFEDFDPVFAKRYDQHIKHVFPNFTIRNCEACHVEAGALVDPAGPADGPRYPVVYNVPDQSQSMPGLLSASDDVATWYKIDDAVNFSDPAVEDTSGRNVGSIPSYVTGAASRACGGCHRARLLRDDAAGALGSLNAHTEAGGTLVENSTDGTDAILYDVIDKIMSVFE